MFCCSLCVLCVVRKRADTTTVLCIYHHDVTVMHRQISLLSLYIRDDAAQYNAPNHRLDGNETTKRSSRKETSKKEARLRHSLQQLQPEYMRSTKTWYSSTAVKLVCVCVCTGVQAGSRNKPQILSQYNPFDIKVNAINSRGHWWPHRGR